MASNLLALVFLFGIIVLQSEADRHERLLGGKVPLRSKQFKTANGAAPQPCNGRIVTILDGTNTVEYIPYKDQKDFIGSFMFADKNFNHYERLSLGYYYNSGAFYTRFNYLNSSQDVSDFVDTIDEGTSGSGIEDAPLEEVLEFMVEENLPSQPGPPITIIVHVSGITSDQVNGASKYGKQLKQQGVRLVLVAHGRYANLDLLAAVTGDASLVFKWKITEHTPPSPDQWLSKLIGCQA